MRNTSFVVVLAFAACSTIACSHSPTGPSAGGDGLCQDAAALNNGKSLPCQNYNASAATHMVSTVAFNNYASGIIPAGAFDVAVDMTSCSPGVNGQLPAPTTSASNATNVGCNWQACIKADTPTPPGMTFYISVVGVSSGGTNFTSFGRGVDLRSGECSAPQIGLVLYQGLRDSSSEAAKIEPNLTDWNGNGLAAGFPPIRWGARQ
jgi:hypothetical protein